jgi:hypothetical protein
VRGRGFTRNLKTEIELKQRSFLEKPYSNQIRAGKSIGFLQKYL